FSPPTSPMAIAHRRTTTGRAEDSASHGGRRRMSTGTSIAAGPGQRSRRPVQPQPARANNELDTQRHAAQRPLGGLAKANPKVDKPNDTAQALLDALQGHPVMRALATIKPEESAISFTS